MAGTVGPEEVYLGTRGPAWDTGPYLKAGCAWHWALTCDVFLQIWLDADALRPRVPALGLVLVVAGVSGHDAVGRPEGEGRRAGRSPES